jgi:hypothetical protein
VRGVEPACRSAAREPTWRCARARRVRVAVRRRCWQSAVLRGCCEDVGGVWVSEREGQRPAARSIERRAASRGAPAGRCTAGRLLCLWRAPSPHRRIRPRAAEGRARCRAHALSAAVPCRCRCRCSARAARHGAATPRAHRSRPFLRSPKGARRSASCRKVWLAQRGPSAHAAPCAFCKSTQEAQTRARGSVQGLAWMLGARLGILPCHVRAHRRAREGHRASSSVSCGCKSRRLGAQTRLRASLAKTAARQMRPYQSSRSERSAVGEAS